MGKNASKLLDLGETYSSSTGGGILIRLRKNDGGARVRLFVMLTGDPLLDTVEAPTFPDDPINTGVTTIKAQRGMVMLSGLGAHDEQINLHVHPGPVTLNWSVRAREGTVDVVVLSFGQHLSATR